MKSRLILRMHLSAWKLYLLYATVLAAASCGGSKPEAGSDNLAIHGRVRLVNDVLYVDQICVQPVSRTIQEIRLEVVLKHAGDAAAETVLSLQAKSSRQFAALLSVGPARVPGVRLSQDTQLEARLDAVIDGAYHFGEPVSIK